MHMRLKKWAKPELAECSYYLDTPEKFRGHWREQFDRELPLFLELGCGKGVGTAKMVSANRNINFVVSDISSNVLGYTRRNIEKAFEGEPVDNVKIVRFDITRIDRIFAPEDSVDRMYINFCNPWTQNVKQAKKRLTHPRQLMLYRQFLKDEGEVRFKTDDEMLFHDTLIYFRYCGFETDYLTEDLHASGFEPNYVSEHEEKFLGKNIPIRFGIFKKIPGAPEIDPMEWERFGPPYTTDYSNGNL